MWDTGTFDSQLSKFKGGIIAVRNQNNIFFIFILNVMCEGRSAVDHV